MVFKRKQQDKPSIKVKVRFALFPIFTDDSILWLQRYYVTYRFTDIIMPTWIREDVMYIISERKRKFYSNLSNTEYILRMRKGAIRSEHI